MFKQSGKVLASIVKRQSFGCIIAKRYISFQDKYELPKYLPDPHKEFGVDVPKTYVPPQYRDPYKKYDDQQNRVNFGEKIHPFHDYMDMWAPDHYHQISDRSAVGQLLIFFAGLGAFAGFIYISDIWPDRPAMPRDYPYDGLYKDLGGKEGEEKLFQARPERGLK